MSRMINLAARAPEPAAPLVVEPSTLPYRDLIAAFHAADDAERAAHDACDWALEAELHREAERLGQQVLLAKRPM